MTELQRRVNILEKKLARLEAESITSGKSKPKHLGKKTKKVLEQEITSHKQNYQEAFSDHEKAQWNKQLLELETEYSQL